MAANTRDIRRRIKSIKNTAQITKAMQMVAAAKMRKAQQLAVAGRPFQTLLHRVLVSLQDRTDESAHPLLAVRPVKRQLIVVISTDKGLCGALNTNLFREIGRMESPAIETSYIAMGRKGMQFLTRTGRQVVAEFELKDKLSFAEARQVAQLFIDKFLAGDADRVSVLYTDFVNTLTQLPRSRAVLPINPLELEAARAEARTSIDASREFIFEPGIAEVLDFVFPRYVALSVYQMLLDARASEHSSRMVAMKNATDNAKQLIKDLTLEYNKIRQASITTELLEITTAQMALG
jgi:F-type H+-transporting ATPase subunit gamma